MNWSNKTVLVTGAGGFIGSHLVSKLDALGASVRGLIRYNSRGNIGALEFFPGIASRIDIKFGDLCDADCVRRAVEGREIVFHLGAIISIPYSYENPSEVVKVNTMGTLNVLSAARDHAVSKVIHTSSSEVYGTAQYVPIDESHPLQGQSPYSASKIAADKLAESFHAAYDLPVGIVRPFNTYGPLQSLRAIIPTVVTQLIVGEQVRLGSLHPTRDFTYVEDTVNGFIKAAESPDIIGEVVNLGVGEEITIGDLAKQIARLLNRDLKITADSERIRPAKSEVDRLCSNNAKAKSLIRWTPEVSLVQGLKQTIKWLEKHLQIHRPDIYNI